MGHFHGTDVTWKTWNRRERVHIISQTGLIGNSVAHHPLDPFTQRSSIPNSIWCLYYRRALTEQPISAYDHRNVRLTGETRSLITTVGFSLLRSRLCGFDPLHCVVSALCGSPRRTRKNNLFSRASWSMFKGPAEFMAFARYSSWD